MTYLQTKQTVQNKHTNVAIFASGKGSNTQNIINYFKNSTSVKIVLVVSNNLSAGVLDIAQKENIPTLVIIKNKFNEDGYRSELYYYDIGLIVLAGFLWKIPVVLIRSYPGRIINIHPALLPKFGGKGMYGDFVHKAVIANNEKQSGITIHLVDEFYDHGKIIFQVKCLIDRKDNASTLGKKIHKLEHSHYPLVIEKIIRDMD